MLQTDVVCVVAGPAAVGVSRARREAESDLDRVALGGLGDRADYRDVQFLAGEVDSVIDAMDRRGVHLEAGLARLVVAVDIDPLNQVVQELAEHDIVRRLAPLEAVDELPSRHKRRDALQLVLRLRPLRLLLVIEVHDDKWAIPQRILRLLVDEALLRKLPELAHDGNETDSGFELVLEPLLLAEQFSIPHPLQSQPFAV